MLLSVLALGVDGDNATESWQETRQQHTWAPARVLNSLCAILRDFPPPDTAFQSTHSSISLRVVMAEPVKEGVDLEAQSGVSRGSGECRVFPRCCYLARCTQTLSKKEVRESEAYELSEHRCEDINRPPTRELEAGEPSDSPAQQQIPPDSKGPSSSGEYPALSL